MKKAAFLTPYKKRREAHILQDVRGRVARRLVHGSLLFNHELLTVKALRDSRPIPRMRVSWDELNSPISLICQISKSVF